MPRHNTLIYDVEEVLDHYGISYKSISGNPNEVDFLCPFHNDQHFGSARFNLKDGRWRCFSCPDGGNLFKFVSQMEHCNTEEAENLIASNFTMRTLNYNLDSLRDKLEHYRMLHSTNGSIRRNSDASLKVVRKMLEGIGRKKVSVDFLEKWFPVLIYYSVNTVEDISSNSHILHVYETFFNELNNKEN